MKFQRNSWTAIDKPLETEIDPVSYNIQEVRVKEMIVLSFSLEQ